ncbi:heavy-metal-associated domain-containing protein [Otariodibacter oris]|uniref:Copper chaperone n=1 Tax=Otariodibacter oris TaxID=1032623 RepID=A0A420XGZ8_9PAST|nr:heavy metal-associated domain-containing protein [Otariodibacter oris]QGM81154.1 hypothetical protein A6A10_06905 [Otariodibacter oris]RKR72707.1 copper chaperone [Otariodibacter oris]
MSVTQLQLDGLHCNACVNSVEKALKTLPSVKDIKIDLATQLAVVESEESAQTLIDTIEDIGFDAKEA